MCKYFAAFCLCLEFLVSCKETGDRVNFGDINFKGDSIIINENSSIWKEIVNETVKHKEFCAEFRTVGTVRAASGKLAEIAPPFTGRIIKSFVALGQKVSAGSPIFELSSSDFYEATKSYFEAKSNYDMAQKNHSRLKDLANNSVASQKELEQVASETFVAKQVLEQSRATLQIFNIDDNNLQMGQPLKVFSPISGEIVKYDITIGNYIKEDANPLAIVADLSKIWVTALVKEKYFGAIKNGDRVEIYTDANPQKIIWGKIYNIGEIFDEETRSLEVIVECENADRELKLGMFTQVHFLSSPSISFFSYYARTRL